MSYRIIFLGLMTAVYACAWYMQSRILFCSDVSVLMHESLKLLAGGRYLKDFFEPNPPMILFLYIPPVLLVKFFSINMILALRLYIFSLGTVTLILSHYFLKKIIADTTHKIIPLFILAMSIVFYMLPNGDFGQREHLLVLLVFPYFLLVACRIENISIPPKIAALVGVMGGLGFCVKPHYVLSFAMLELYYQIIHKRLLPRLRIELLMFCGIIISYIFTILYFFPEYIGDMVPMSLRFYYSGLGIGLTSVVFNPIFVFCAFTFLFFTFQYQKTSCKVIGEVLLVGLVSFLITHLLQDTDFYYHILPAYSFAILLDVFLFLMFISQKTFSRDNLIRLSILSLLVLYFLVTVNSTIWVSLIFMPGIFFGFFTILFATLFYLTENKRNILKICFALFISISCTVVFAYFAQHTPWFSHRFILTVILLIMWFGFFVSEKIIKKSHAIFAAVLGVILFAYPMFTGASRFVCAEFLKDNSKPLVSFLQNYAQHKSIMAFSSLIVGYPAIDYAVDVSYASKYPFLVWLPSLVNEKNSKLESDKKYYIESVAQELDQNHPDFVLVDVKFHKATLSDPNFEYLPYFSTNPTFKMAWNKYHYFMTVVSYPSIKLDVYQRI